MARKHFVEQLKAMGFSVEEIGEDRVAFPFTVAVGKFAGKEIRLGFVVPGDFPDTPPSGPHISPQLLPFNNTSQKHPEGGIHKSDPFGQDWQYWSRPCPNWATTDRSVRAYMAHIVHLFDTQ
jgi:hypothetical protein